MQKVNFLGKLRFKYRMVIFCYKIAILVINEMYLEEKQFLPVI